MSVIHDEAVTVDPAVDPALGKPRIVDNLYEVLSRSRDGLLDVIWEQQRFHEHRRWSAVEYLRAVDIRSLGENDRTYVWNFGRAELTTKPGADRLARLSDSECRKWVGKDDVLASVLQACGTWSRYWNEEEAHHESVLTHLSRMLSCEPIRDDVVIRYREIFGDDDMLRTLFLLAISEINATVFYTSMASKVEDEGLRALFRRIATDEMHHLRYFVSFARALVDSGQYSPRSVLAVAHLFVRPGGELYGSARDRIEDRRHVNWWDHLEFKGAERPDDHDRQRKLIFAFVEDVTSIAVNSAEEVEDRWLEMVG